MAIQYRKLTERELKTLCSTNYNWNGETRKRISVDKYFRLCYYGTCWWRTWEYS